MEGGVVIGPRRLTAGEFVTHQGSRRPDLVGCNWWRPNPAPRSCTRIGLKA